MKIPNDPREVMAQLPQLLETLNRELGPCCANITHIMEVLYYSQQDIPHLAPAGKHRKIQKLITSANRSLDNAWKKVLRAKDIIDPPKLD